MTSFVLRHRLSCSLVGEITAIATLFNEGPLAEIGDRAGVLPVLDHGPMHDEPLAITSLEPVDVTPTEHPHQHLALSVRWRHVVRRYVRLRVGDVAVDLDQNVAEHVLGSRPPAAQPWDN